MLLSWLAHVKAVMGCRPQAQALIARARSFERMRYVPPFHLALAYTGLGDVDEAFEALDQAWLDRDPALATLDAEPRFEPLKRPALPHAGRANQDSAFESGRVDLTPVTRWRAPRDDRCDTRPAPHSPT